MAAKEIKCCVSITIDGTKHYVKLTEVLSHKSFPPDKSYIEGKVRYCAEALVKDLIDRGIIGKEE